MSVLSMKQLLEAGVHFGHQTKRWNPKMAPYIFTERNGIYIIDLQKSVGKVDEAYNAMSEIAAAGGKVLPTKKSRKHFASNHKNPLKKGFFYVKIHLLRITHACDNRSWCFLFIKSEGPEIRDTCGGDP